MIHMAGPSWTEHEARFVTDAILNGGYEKAYYYIELFEKEFAKYLGRKYALMTPNCTTAIHLVLTGLDIHEQDEVIVPELTWIGSVAGVVYLRAMPVFADVDSLTWTLDIPSVLNKITDNTKAIIAVNLHGNMCDFKTLEKIAREGNMFLIEDAAQSLGSIKYGRKSGTFGIASVFSFHRTKTLCTGEGGMMVTDDTQLYNRCKFLRDHGRQPGTYYNTEVTYKYVPSNIVAALGYAQLLRIDELITIKRWQQQVYEDALKGLPVAMNYNYGEPNGAWVNGVVFAESTSIKKVDAMKRLSDMNVPSRPFFWPLSSLPAFENFKTGKEPETNPTAYSLSDRGINLPCAMNLTEVDLKFVADGVRRLFNDI